MPPLREPKRRNQKVWLFLALALGIRTLCFFSNRGDNELLRGDQKQKQTKKKKKKLRSSPSSSSAPATIAAAYYNHSAGLAAADSQTQQPKLQQFQVEELCDFYLAESSIPHGGLGVFTAKPLKKGEMAQPWPDICLYLTDADSEEGTEIDTHTWQSYRFGAQWLGSFRGDVRAACMGLVTIFNSMGMQDYASARPAAVYNLIHTNGGLDRSRDPGAGAITQYYGASSQTLRDLAAGSELMLWDDGHGGSNYEEDKTPEFPGKHHDQNGDAVIIPPQRPPEWLQKHGMCMDNILVQSATDPAMGRGAFAKRFMKRGTVVAPAPLQVYPDRSKFAVPDDEDLFESGYRRNILNEVYESPEQLFVNYCFQPKQSSLLLYPYGAGVGLINHANETSGKINVVLQWSTHHTNHGTQWLDPWISLEQFFKMQYPGSIIVNVVALRDLQPGEELFMDYGSEWEKAWNRHVENWNPPPKSEDYVYPWDEMKRHGILPGSTSAGAGFSNDLQIEKQVGFRTFEEQKKDPYPSNLMMVCDTSGSHDGPDGQQRHVWQPSPEGSWPEDLVECRILKRAPVYNGKNDNTPSTAPPQYVYQVVLKVHDDDDDEEKGEDGSSPPPVIKLPHHAIRFVDKPFQSDQHISNSFRHPIGFPEVLTPPSWKNQ